MVMLGVSDVLTYSSVMVIYARHVKLTGESRQPPTLTILSTRQAVAQTTLTTSKPCADHATKPKPKQNRRQTAGVGEKLRGQAARDRPPAHIFTQAKLKV